MKRGYVLTRCSSFLTSFLKGSKWTFGQNPIAGVRRRITEPVFLPYSHVVYSPNTSTNTAMLAWPDCLAYPRSRASFPFSSALLTTQFVADMKDGRASWLVGMQYLISQSANLSSASSSTRSLNTLMRTTLVLRWNLDHKESRRSRWTVARRRVRPYSVNR